MLREEEGREGGPVGTLSPKRETSSRSQRARGEEKEEDKTDEDDERDDGVDRQHNNITTSERILTSVPRLILETRLPDTLRGHVEGRVRLDIQNNQRLDSQSLLRDGVSFWP